MKKLLKSEFVGIIVSPVVYALFIPFLIIDASIFVYQTICFPVYGIRKVKRSNFIAYDRNLNYLTGLERFNCQYCGYINGLVAYIQEIAGRSEQYWCPIKHARKVRGRHPVYEKFADHGDRDAYQQLIEKKLKIFNNSEKQ